MRAVNDNDLQMDWIRDLSDKPFRSPTFLESLTMYTVYYDPCDYPGKYVLRACQVCDGDVRAIQKAIVADDLDTIRASIPSELFRLPRDDNDESSIVEVWI